MVSRARACRRRRRGEVRRAILVLGGTGECFASVQGKWFSRLVRCSADVEGWLYWYARVARSMFVFPALSTAHRYCLRHRWVS